MKIQVYIVGVSWLLLASQPVLADSVLDRRYTWTKLDGLWQTTLGMRAPEPERFAMLVQGPGTAEPVRTLPTDANLGVPFPGEVIGESVSPAGQKTIRAFPVIPLSREDAAVMNRRLAWAEIYLTRYRYFEAASTDKSDVLTTLTVRQYAAGLEAYLITARLYFAAPDLTGKCVHLTRMRELTKATLAGLRPEALPVEWRPLIPIHKATALRLQTDTLTGLVCSVEPVRGRAETVRMIETHVRERIMQEVRRKVQDTLQLLEAASTEFQSLVNSMDVPIASAKIMELERVLGNARANMILVKKDQLKAADTIAKLQAVDLASLNQPGQLNEFQKAQSHMATMVGLIDDVLMSMSELAKTIDNPAIVQELAPCAALKGAYSALDLTRDTGTLAQQIGKPYEDCIAHARAVVARFQKPSLDKAIMAALARHVRQISEAYLSTVRP